MVSMFINGINGNLAEGLGENCDLVKNNLKRAVVHTTQGWKYNNYFMS